jgi:hypothetical protein
MMVNWSVVPGIALGVAIVLIILMIVVLARRQQRMESAAGHDVLPASGMSGNPPIRRYILCYALFFLILLLGVAVFFDWTQNLRALLAAADLRWELNRLLYMVGMGFIGFSMFILVAAAEPYLRGGVEQQDLARRFLQLMLVVGAFWLVGLAGRLLALGML